MNSENDESNQTVARIVAVVIVTILVVVTLVSLVALWLGKEISSSGHTAETQIREIIVGNDVFRIPANFIRFKAQRNATTSKRIDLYFHWPSGNGFSEELRAEFNQSGISANLIFASIIERESEIDMSGRLVPVYQSLFEGVPRHGPSGLIVQKLRADAGIGREDLYYQRDAPAPYVARCTVSIEPGRPAMCLRDFNLGQNLTVIYRFPARHIKNWRRIDAIVSTQLARFLVK